MDQRIELLARRVDRLERSNRLSRILSIVAFGSLVAITQVPVLSATVQGVVAAHEFHLVSGSGQLEATLGSGPAGGALTFFDRTGARTVLVGMGPFGNWAGLTAFDANAALPGGSGIVRAHWGLSNSVGPTEFFKDESSMTRAVLFKSGANGQGLGYRLEFNDSANKLLTRVGESPDDQAAGLFLFDGNALLSGTGAVRGDWNIAATGGGTIAEDYLD